MTSPATATGVGPGVGGLLVRALAAHRDGDQDGVYDEVLHTVSARAAADGSLGKADIGALVLWKRITAQARWANTLMLTPDVVVRRATGAAFEHGNDTSQSIPEAGQAARNALWDLPGMRGTGALASAVLLALAPTRMAVWDRRVGEALTALGMYPEQRVGFYGTYLATALNLAACMDAAAGVDPANRHTPRDLDLALFHIAGSAPMLNEARSLDG